jgi:UDP-glucose 4-epimerase
MKGKIVVLGAGFVGGALVRSLCSTGRGIRLFVRPHNQLSRLQGVLKDVELAYGDFQDEGAVEAALEGVETVCHLITTTFPAQTIASGVYDVRSNLLPSIKLVELCLKGGVRDIIYLSSGGTVYGTPQFLPITEDHPLRPVSLYGQSKAMIESYFDFIVRTTPLKIKVLRGSNAYGPGQNPFGLQGIIPVAMGCLLIGRPINVVAGEDYTRDFVYIDDVVNAIVRSLIHQESLLANISSSRGVKISEVLELIERIAGKSLLRNALPPRKGDVVSNVLDNTCARRLLGWTPSVTIEEGIQRTWDWMKTTVRE